MLINLSLIHIKLNTDSNKYDGKSFRKLEEADIEDILLLPENAYPAEFKVMTNGEEILLSRAHFRFEGQEYFAAFRVLDEQGKDCSDGFRMFYIQNEARVTMHYDATRKLFYDMPKIKGVVENNTRFFKYANSLKDGALGSIFAGDSDLFVESFDGTKSLSFKLRVLPSSLSEESYRYMINDLINIKLDLLSSKERESKQYVELGSTQGISSDIEEQISSIKEICYRINDKPYTNLNLKLGKIPVNKIKRYDTRTICSFLKNPLNDKLLVMQPKETFDIYEHKAIKRVLLNTKKLLSIYLFNKNRNIVFQFKLNEKRLTMLKKKYGFNDTQDDDKKATIFFNQMILKDQYYSEWQKSLYFNKMILLLNPIIESPKETIIIKLCPDYSFKRQRMYFNNNLLCSEHSSYGNPKITLKFCSTDLEKHILFWNIINSSKYKEFYLRCEISLQKRIVNQYGKINEIFIINDFEVKKGCVNKFIYSSEIASKYINKNIFQKMYVADLQNIENDSKLFIQLKNKRDRLSKIINSDLSIIKRKKIEFALDEILALDFLNSSSFEDIDLHQTQIFDNDSRYKRLFEILTSFNDMLELTLFNNSEKILIKETHKLYEYWLLAKMVHVLIIEQGWHTKEVRINNNSVLPMDNGSIIKAIGKALSLESTKISTNNSISIILKHSCGIEINIEFNAKLQGTNLTPDYFISVSSYMSKKYFILDAKYRDYNDMGEECFYSDIKEVCKEKYLDRINDNWRDFLAYKRTMTAAFIVSNGSKNEKDNVESKWNYWGGTTDKRIEGKKYGNPMHRYGSFVCSPGVESNGLKKFFEMIFEYHLNRWDVCWNCGHVLNENEKLIKNPYSDGKKIYHCTCTECNEFWVKSYCAGGDADLLVKHYDNYHTEVDNGYHWYVECPKCGHF